MNTEIFRHHMIKFKNKEAAHENNNYHCVNYRCDRPYYALFCFIFSIILTKEPRLLCEVDNRGSKQR